MWSKDHIFNSIKCTMEPYKTTISGGVSRASKSEKHFCQLGRFSDIVNITELRMICSYANKCKMSPLVPHSKLYFILIKNSLPSYGYNKKICKHFTVSAYQEGLKKTSELNFLVTKMISRV